MISLIIALIARVVTMEGADPVAAGVPAPLPALPCRSPRGGYRSTGTVSAEATAAFGGTGIVSLFAYLEDAVTGLFARTAAPLLNPTLYAHRFRARSIGRNRRRGGGSGTWKYELSAFATFSVSYLLFRFRYRCPVSLAPRLPYRSSRPAGRGRGAGGETESPGDGAGYSAADDGDGGRGRKGPRRIGAVREGI